MTQVFEMNSRVIALFIILQLADVLTTLIAFNRGGYEMNPLVGALLGLGTVGGLIAAKLIVTAIMCLAIKCRPGAIRRGNFFFFAVVAWNCFVIFAKGRA